MSPRPVILIFLARYLPGYKAGGALRTIVNTTEALSEYFCFKIVTNDRDSGDLEPYPSIRPDSWQQVGKAEVLYLSKDKLTLRRCKQILEETQHDVVYLQSCFSLFTIKPLIANKLSRGQSGTQVIVAPRGEFYPGALSIRRFKKLAYLSFARLFRLYAGAVWQASNDEEAAAIGKWFGPNSLVVVAPDIARDTAQVEPEQRCKTPGKLRILFLSRICPKKNLDCALRILGSVTGSVTFDIVGPAEDLGYWKTCQQLIGDLPGNIQATYKGTVPHEQVRRVLSEYELLLFPTLGENFGHIILESLLAGCPVLISDQTPWRNLEEAGAGWEFSLDRLHAFTETIQACVNMGEPEHRRLREQARNMGQRYVTDDNVLAANRDLLMAPPGKRL